MRKVLLAVSFVAFSLCACPTASGQGDGESKVKVVADINYHQGKDADPDKHKLDLYLPAGQKDFPVLFFIHGGGWRAGSRKKFAAFATQFAKEGIGTVAISYRLSPQVKHPGHIEDVAEAFAWTVKNIGKYGGDADNIFVSGHSAGGHLAALLATDGRYLEKYGLGLKNIQGAIPISGVYEITPKRLAAVFGDDPEECKAASPLTHASKECPPFLVLYAEKDGAGFDKMAEQFTNRLKKMGVEATVMEMAGRDHGSIVNTLDGPEHETMRQMLQFIRKHQE